MGCEVGESILVQDISDATPEFTMVPQSICQGDDWEPVYAGRWRRREHITTTEARAYVWSVRHRVRSFSGIGRRCLSLGDNLPMVLAAAKGRAKGKGLLQMCRVLLSISFAAGSRF